MAAGPRAIEDDARARFGARSLLAAVALVLVAVPFALLLLLVEERWRPLVRVDVGARDSLNAFALAHDGFVTAMKVVSVLGSARVYTPLFTLLVLWLAWNRLPRLALFVAVTLLGGATVNATVKALVDRARPRPPGPCGARPGPELSERPRAVRRGRRVGAAARLPPGAARTVAHGGDRRGGGLGAPGRVLARRARGPLRLRRPRRLLCWGSRGWRS